MLELQQHLRTLLHTEVGVVPAKKPVPDSCSANKEIIVLTVELGGGCSDVGADGLFYGTMPT